MLERMHALAGVPRGLVRCRKVGPASFAMAAFALLGWHLGLVPVGVEKPTKDQPVVEVPDTLLQYPGSALQQIYLEACDPEIEPTHMVVKVMFGTDDPPEKVIAYFAERLKPFGTVWVGKVSTLRFPRGRTTMSLKRAGSIPIYLDVGRAPRSYLDLVQWHPEEGPVEDDETKVIWTLTRPIPRW